VNSHWTLQLQNEGNYEGEGSNRPGSVSLIGDFPEVYPGARYYPEGRLQNFQRNRFRLWSIYNVGLGRAGALSFSGLWRVEGSRVYSLAHRNRPLNDTQNAILAAAGYPDGPSTAHVYFGERGSERFPGYGLFDVSLNYDIPVFRSLRPWVKFDLYNAFDNQKLIAWDTTVAQNMAGALDEFGLATTFTEGANFGKATGNTVTNVDLTNIPTFPTAFNAGEPGFVRGGRTFRMAVGFRF
jgi:hypothetical protein